MLNSVKEKEEKRDSIDDNATGSSVVSMGRGCLIRTFASNTLSGLRFTGERWSVAVISGLTRWKAFLHPQRSTSQSTMMEEVEQDWRPYYDACYKRPPAAAKFAMGHVDTNQAQASVYNEGLEMHARGSAAKLVSFEKNSSEKIGRKTSSILLRSLVLFVIGALCLTIVILIVVNLSNAAHGGPSGDDNSEPPKEVSLHLDAPQLPKPVSSRRPVAAPAAKSQAKPPPGKQKKPSKQAPTESVQKDNQVTADKEGAGASEDRQRCVEWSYPDGYCATKLRGVARSLRECRDNCLGPGTSDNVCTLPAEYTCPSAEMKFPYFAYTFPNGTVACLLADAERLRPHRCLVGENKYTSREECRKACSKNPDTKEKRKKP
ncbi:hypothetical protein MTO96_022203 [Rhipicephalus appendiculatus]